MVYLYYLFNGRGNCRRFFIFYKLAVQKCIEQDVVMTNEIPLMYMMSTSIAMVPCRCIIFVSSSCIVVTTLDDFFCTVLPCSDPILTPNMSLACSMSALLMGQLGIMFRSMYSIKSCVFGLPIIFCKE